MGVQRVLIVDDSKTAQIRLKKMLKRYDIEVDVAFSAEEALDHLSYRMPAVIFLDHHMEGMDGLEALKIIKANPRTAMIPVIMYTSQSGDVYVGQARALGALDILSKEVIKPASVEQVLSRLNIFPENKKIETSKQEPSHKIATVAHRSSGVTKFPDRNDTPTIGKKSSSRSNELDSAQLRKQVARLFEIHIADIRKQISENTKFTIRQFSSELKRSREPKTNDDETLSSEIDQETTTKVSSAKILTNAILSLILIGVGLISIQLLQSHGKLTELADKHSELIEINTKQNRLLTGTHLEASLEETTTKQFQVNHGLLLDALSWAMNINMTFPYAQDPLGESQVMNLQNLTNRLDNAGFNGLIKLNIHFGNFCVKRTSVGGWTVAESSFSFSQCIFAQDVQFQSNPDDFLTMGYLQFTQTSAPIQNGDITVALDFKEFNAPLNRYPVMNDSITVSEWNAIAATNNRISIEFELETNALTSIETDYQ